MLAILVVGVINQISKNHLISLIVFEVCIGEPKFMMIFHCSVDGVSVVNILGEVDAVSVVTVSIVKNAVCSL